MIFGKDIFLRLMEEKDIPLKVNWVNDEEIRETLISDFISESGTKAWFKKVIADNSRKEFFICLRDNNIPIGFTSLKNIDLTNSKAELSMLIGEKQFWGKGYAKEARRLIVSYGFSKIGLNKIYTYNWVENFKIIGLNKKLGFKVDGVLRKEIFFNGAFRDMAVMSVLKDEWMQNESNKI